MIYWKTVWSIVWLIYCLIDRFSDWFDSKTIISTLEKLDVRCLTCLRRRHSMNPDRTCVVSCSWNEVLVKTNIPGGTSRGGLLIDFLHIPPYTPRPSLFSHCHIGSNLSHTKRCDLLPPLQLIPSPTFVATSAADSKSYISPSCLSRNLFFSCFYVSAYFVSLVGSSDRKLC